MSRIIHDVPLRPTRPSIGPIRPNLSCHALAIEAFIHEYYSKKQCREVADSEPIHVSYYKMKAGLTWRVKNHTESAHGSFLVDTGCTSPILNEEKVKKLKIPVRQWQQAVQILDAAGGTIKGGRLCNTRPLDMIIGKHEQTLPWEVSPLPEDVLGYLPTSWLSTHNPDINREFDRPRWRSVYCRKHCLPTDIAVKGISIEELMLEDSSNGYQVGAAIYHDEIGQDIALHHHEDSREWADFFSQESMQTLAEHSEFDHKIDLLPDTTPLSAPLYTRSTSELKAMKTWLSNNTNEGKIRKSNSLASSSILLIPKPDGSLPLCVEYHGLKKIKVKEHYPLPRMDELTNRLGTAKLLTKFNLKNGFHLLRMRKRDEWNTAFRTRYGLYEYQVMPFGLCNVPPTFQAMIDALLHDLINQGVIAYIDDIHIYSESESEHIRLVQKVVLPCESG